MDAAAASPASQEPAAEGLLKKNKLPIMVVDDSEMDRMVSEAFVEELGFDVVCAGSGEECVQILSDMMNQNPLSRAPPVALIMLDVLMPKMDGYETLKHLKSNRRLRNIPVVMITGIDDRANIASFLRAGVDDYVLKPLVLPELQVRITVCLERRRLLTWVDNLERDGSLGSGGPTKGMLRHSWTFWFDSPVRTTSLYIEGESALFRSQNLGGFSTIKEFWQVWGELNLKLPTYSNFRLFKHGQATGRLDPANVNGGQIVIHAKKSDTSRIWFELILVVITEQLSNMGLVNGIVLSIRPKENHVCIWVRSEEDDQKPFITQMSDTLRGLLGLKASARICHQYHTEVDAQLREESLMTRGRTRGSPRHHSTATFSSTAVAGAARMKGESDMFSTRRRRTQSATSLNSRNTSSDDELGSPILGTPSAANGYGGLGTLAGDNVQRGQQVLHGSRGSQSAPSTPDHSDSEDADTRTRGHEDTASAAATATLEPWTGSSSTPLLPSGGADWSGSTTEPPPASPNLPDAEESLRQRRRSTAAKDKGQGDNPDAGTSVAPAAPASFGRLNVLLLVLLLLTWLFMLGRSYGVV